MLCGSLLKVARIHFKDTVSGVRIKSNRDRGKDFGNFDFRDLIMEDVGAPMLITEYYPKIPDHDAAQPLTRLRPHFHDIHISNLTATGAKQAWIIVGLPESPITSITLTGVHIIAQKGMTVSDATVTAHDFSVTAEEGEKFTLLANARIDSK